MQVDWEGFPVRLGREIDRWPHGGQGRFSGALRDMAERERLGIPKSYRTLVNYLQGNYRPSEAWVIAAAKVLGVRPDYLLTGEGPERDGIGLRFIASEDASARTSAIMSAFVNRHHHLPMGARLMVAYFLEDYFALRASHDPPAQDRKRHEAEITGVVQTYFGCLVRPSRRPHAQTMVLAASLCAAAYMEALGTTQPSDKEEEEPWAPAAAYDRMPELLETLRDAGVAYMEPYRYFRDTARPDPDVVTKWMAWLDEGGEGDERAHVPPGEDR